jgi:hypothetical protein
MDRHGIRTFHTDCMEISRPHPSMGTRTVRTVRVSPTSTAAERPSMPSRSSPTTTIPFHHHYGASRCDCHVTPSHNDTNACPSHHHHTFPPPRLSTTTMPFHHHPFPPPPPLSTPTTSFHPHHHQPHHHHHHTRCIKTRPPRQTTPPRRKCLTNDHNGSNAGRAQQEQPGGYRWRDVHGMPVFLSFFLYFSNTYLTCSNPSPPLHCQNPQTRKNATTTDNPRKRA